MPPAPKARFVGVVDVIACVPISVSRPTVFIVVYGVIAHSIGAVRNFSKSSRGGRDVDIPFFRSVRTFIFCVWFFRTRRRFHLLFIYFYFTMIFSVVITFDASWRLWIFLIRSLLIRFWTSNCKILFFRCIDKDKLQNKPNTVKIPFILLINWLFKRVKCF